MSITSGIKAQRTDSDVYFAATQRLRQELHLRINMMRIFAFALVVNVVLQTVGKSHSNVTAVFWKIDGWKICLNECV